MQDREGGDSCFGETLECRDWQYKEDHEWLKGLINGHLGECHLEVP